MDDWTSLGSEQYGHSSGKATVRVYSLGPIRWEWSADCADGTIFSDLATNRENAMVMAVNHLKLQGLLPAVVPLTNWDRRWLEHAAFKAQYSKDPSSKVGAVIVAPASQTAVADGWNGFPRGVNDKPQRYACREYKVLLAEHAGIKRVVCLAPADETGFMDRWAHHLAIAETMFREAGVECIVMTENLAHDTVA